VRVRYLVGMNPFPSKAVGNLLYDDAAYLNGRVGLPVNAESAGITAPVAQPATRRICIDLGTPSRASGAGWNNPAWPGTTPTALVDDQGRATSMSLVVTDGFAERDAFGIAGGADGLPGTATSDCWFGCNDWSGRSEATAALRLTGLDPAKGYVVSCFASRLGAGTGLSAQYTLTGTGAPVVLERDAGDPAPTMARSATLAPTATGTIDLLVRKGTGNTNRYGYYFLGAVLIEEVTPAAPVAPPVVAPPVVTLPPSATAASVRRVRIDLGTPGRSSGAGWNNPAWPGTTPTALVDDQGRTTPMSLVVTDGFAERDDFGLASGADGLPGTATSDCWFGCDAWSGRSEATAALRLTGLDPAKAYVVSCFASRLGAGTGLSAHYTLTGTGAPVVLERDAGDPAPTMARSATLAPTATGAIDLLVRKGTGNTNRYGYYFLGAVLIEEVTPAAPATPVAPPPATVTVLRRVAIDVGGGRPTPAPWNNLVWPARSLAALKDDTGLATPFALTVTEPFLNSNVLGVDAASGVIPASALVDFQFGGANFQGQSATRAAIKLSGLDPTATYTLSMGASRTGVTDNRETRYTAVGAGAPVVRLLQIVENRGVLAVADGLRPAADGTLMLYVDQGPANTTINGFFYLGVLLVDEVRTVAAGPG